MLDNALMRYANDAEIEQQIQMFGANMRAARKRANMTQTDLAAVDGLDRAAISLTEKGKRSPDMRTLLRIAHGVQATPAELVRGIGDHENPLPIKARAAGGAQSNGFGANLLQARQSLNLSQQALGARAEVDAAAISLYERGQREPNLRTILKLARTLQTSPAQLLRGVR